MLILNAEVNNTGLYSIGKFKISCYSFLRIALILKKIVYLFVSFFCPTRECFTHLVSIPLPVKGYTFWPMLGTHGYWVVRDLWHTTPRVTWVNPLWTLTPVAERFAVELSIPVLMAYVEPRSVKQNYMEPRSVKKEFILDK